MKSENHHLSIIQNPIPSKRSMLLLLQLLLLLLSDFILFFYCYFYFYILICHLEVKLHQVILSIINYIFYRSYPIIVSLIDLKTDPILGDAKKSAIIASVGKYFN